jgi:hypothetical protein
MKTILLMALAFSASCGNGEPSRVALTVSGGHEAIAIDRGHAWLVSPRRLDVALDDDGAARFARASAAHVGERVVVTVDGAPIGSLLLREPITDGRLSITLAPDDSGHRLRALVDRLTPRQD